MWLLNVFCPHPILNGKYHHDFCCPFPPNKRLKVSLIVHNTTPSKLRPLHTRDWEPVTNTLQALSLVEKAELVQVRFTLCLRDQRSMWMQAGCKACMDSYMASNRLYFMDTRTIYKNHLLEVGLTQNRETMALRTLTTIASFYFVMHEDPHA